MGGELQVALRGHSLHFICCPWHWWVTYWHGGCNLYKDIHAALQLMALAVREDRQSQGIGTALLEELLRIGKG